MAAQQRFPVLSYAKVRMEHGFIPPHLTSEGS